MAKHLITVKFIQKYRLGILPVGIKMGLEAADSGCCDDIIREDVPVCLNSVRKRWPRCILAKVMKISLLLPLPESMLPLWTWGSWSDKCHWCICKHQWERLIFFSVPGLEVWDVSICLNRACIWGDSEHNVTNEKRRTSDACTEDHSKWKQIN